MNKIISKIKALFERIRAYFPSPLPRGLKEAEEWAQSTIRLSGLPYNDSTKFALCVKVLHLGETDSKKAKEFFIRGLHKAAANQVVSQIINDLKEKQQAEIKAAQEAAKQAEATAPAVGNEP